MQQKRILIVEDDVGIQTLTKFSLEMEHTWEVEVADNGQEALSKAIHFHPEIILLDLILPDLSGVQVIASLTSDRATAKIPIILFTAKLLEPEIAENQSGNIVGIIQKPFDSLTLSSTILDILNKQPQLVSNR